MEMKMNTKMIRNSFAAALVVVGALTANAASAYERWVKINNTADTAVLAVQISHINDNFWGPDILPGVIQAHSGAVVDPVNTQGYCRFDVRLSYADGTTAEIRNVNLCEALSITTDGYAYRVTTI